MRCTRPLAELRNALGAMELDATTELPLSHAAYRALGAERTGELVSALDPSFRAQELSFAVTQVGTQHRAHRGRRAAQLVAARHWATSPRASAGRSPRRRSAPSRTSSRHSVWLHNSVRGAVGLGLAVLVANKTGVQHSFWVIFGHALGAALERAQHGPVHRARDPRHLHRLRDRRRACSRSSAPTRRCSGSCCRSPSCSPASRPRPSRSPRGRPRSRSRC